MCRRREQQCLPTNGGDKRDNQFELIKLKIIKMIAPILQSVWMYAEFKWWELQPLHGSKPKC